MFLRIEPSSPVPIYQQIGDQLRFAIASGRLVEGEKLPGARELAELLSINLHTVTRAYGELVREGTLEMRRGRGTFVGSVEKGQLEEARAAFEVDVRKLCRDAFAQGANLDELRELLNRIWTEEEKEWKTPSSSRE